MTEKVTESIKFLMSEIKRLLKKEKEGTITKSEIETSPENTSPENTSPENIFPEKTTST